MSFVLVNLNFAMFLKKNFQDWEKFDIIASRNMIIYFDHESKLKLMERFHRI